MATVPQFIQEAQRWPEDCKTAVYLLTEVIDRYHGLIEAKPNPGHRNYLSFTDVDHVLDLFDESVQHPIRSFLLSLVRTIPDLNQNQLYHLMLKATAQFRKHVKPIEQGDLEKAVADIRTKADERFSELSNNALAAYGAVKKKEETKFQL